VVRKIGRCYDHGIQVAILNKVSVDSIVTGLMAASASDGARAEHPRFVCFADCANANGRLVETRSKELHAAEAGAYDADDDPIGGSSGDRQGAHASGKKIPAIHRI
jgi:hypothetical protein